MVIVQRGVLLGTFGNMLYVHKNGCTMSQSVVLQTRHILSLFYVGGARRRDKYV